MFGQECALCNKGRIRIREKPITMATIDVVNVKKWAKEKVEYQELLWIISPCHQHECLVSNVSRDPSLIIGQSRMMLLQYIY